MNKKEIIGICEFLRVHHFENSYKLLDYYNKYKKQKEVLDKIKEYCKGNIQVLENRLNTPFCNFEKATKELSIHQNYLELLEEIE